MGYKSYTVSYKLNLNYGANRKTIDKAKNLRMNMTDAEKILWKNLKDSKLDGFKFRRQHPIWIFIADFYCHEQKLVIELDGDIHELPDRIEYDIRRTTELENFGIKILRFKNENVFNDIENVLNTIRAVLLSRK